MPKLKPNGLPIGTFVMHIDDGFNVFRYELKTRRKTSARDVAAAAAKGLKGKVTRRELVGTRCDPSMN